MSAADGSGEPMNRYFSSIETIFIGLRGAPLLLSPEDWQVARGWHRDGIPIEIVREALEATFEARAERGQTARRVQSLRYCAPAVEEAWERHRQLVAGGERDTKDGGFDVSARLVLLAEALPDDLADVDEWRGRIEALAGSDAEAVETDLLRLDRELIGQAMEAISPDELARERAKAIDRLERPGRPLSDEMRRDSADRLLRQVVRRRLRLPILSLFSVDG